MTRHSSNYIFLFISIALFCSCTAIPKGHFGANTLAAPDYSFKKNWAALPSESDSADAVPIPAWQDAQATSSTDVFFIHPTSYIGKRGQKKWNADINDEKVNLDVDKYPIRFQATIFNGAGKIYAPRYRQAHLHSFFTKRKDDAKKAIALAYEDILRSFQYYLDHYNNGRPFIIAGHSQGSLHGQELLKDLMDGKPLQEKLIVAYLPGWPVLRNYFKNIKPCIDSLDTGCFCSWRTVKEGTFPNKLHIPNADILITNPVTWTLDPAPSAKEKQLGGVLRDFHTLYPALVSARIYEDFLWVNKPQFPGSVLLVKNNYHIADYNLFYADVRKNAQDRARAYLARH